MKKGREENLKPFKVGDDPRRNMQGRPHKLPEIDSLMAKILDSENNAEAILKALVKRAKSKGGDRAAEILLNRGYGMPKQTITGNQDITVTVRHES